MTYTKESAFNDIMLLREKCTGLQHEVEIMRAELERERKNREALRTEYGILLENFKTTKMQQNKMTEAIGKLQSEINDK